MFLLVNGFAQNTELDSLQNLFENENNAKEKALILLKISEVWSYTDSTKAFQKIKEAQEITGKENREFQGISHFFEGQIYFEYNSEKAKESYQKAYEILEDFDSEIAKEYELRAWGNYAIYYQIKGRDDLFLEIVLNECLPRARALNDTYYIARCYADVAIVLWNQKDYAESIKYSEMSVNALKSTINPLRYVALIDNYLRISQCSVYLNEAESAKENLANAKSLLDKYPKDYQYSSYYLISTLYYEFLENFSAAVSESEKGISFAKKSIGNNDLGRLMYHKAYCLRKLGRYKEAKTTLNQILKNKENYMASNKGILYKEFSLLLEEMQDYKGAFDYSQLRNNFYDSLNAGSTAKMINELETKFSISEQQREIINQELKLDQKNQFMWLIGIASVIILWLGTFMYIYYQNKKKLAKQTEVNLNQQLKEKEQTEQLQITKAILDGEERERQRVARDLHDGLGGMLAGVKINLSSWSQNNLDYNQTQGFYKILNQLDSSVSELRRVSRNLMPESLLNFGLEIALKDLCDFYMKDDLQIDFQALNISKSLSLTTQINIYRIVQELLSNAVKHAQATNIFVQCSQTENQFFITIEDNGKGITEEDKVKIKSLGLKNLKNRVEFLKGKMEILSDKIDGTTINIELKSNVA